VSAKPIAGLAPGTVVAGRYRVEGVLGEGGMGCVLRARDLAAGRPVALKLIRAELAERVDLLRFEREARLAAEAGRGGGVVRVHDLGRHQGRPFCQELEALLKRGVMSLEAGVDVVAAVARTLADVHAAGVVHRDLKPVNVLVEPDGRTRLLDFGLARRVDGTVLTETGELLGTPSYMAPEQLESADVEARADV